MAEDIRTIDFLASLPQIPSKTFQRKNGRYYEFIITISELDYFAFVQTDSKLLFDLYPANDDVLLAEIRQHYDRDTAFWGEEKPELLLENKENLLDSAIIKSLQNIIFEHYKTENALATIILESSGLSNDTHATIYQLMRRKTKDSLPLFDDVTGEIAGYQRHLDGFRILINDNH